MSHTVSRVLGEEFLAVLDNEILSQILFSMLQTSMNFSKLENKVSKGF